MRLFCTLAIVFTSLTSATVSTSAQTKFPTKTITLILPFAAGGGTDVQARLIAPKMEEILGQRVIVENKPGGSGSIASRYVKDAAPDGHTILVGTSSTHVVYPALSEAAGFDPLKDFAPVVPIITGQYVLYVNPSLNVKTVAELLTALKTNPGKYNYSSSGVGGLPHLLGEMFKLDTGTQMTHVAYQGNAPAVTALVQNEVQINFNGAENMPLAKEGKIIAIGGSDPNPVSPIAGVEPISNTVPGFNATVWTGLFVPAATPKDVVEKLRDATEKALNSSDVKQKLTEMGLSTLPSQTKILSDLVTADFDRYRSIAKAAAIKLDPTK